MSSSKSAFEAIPGKDALVEYQSKVYPQTSYVERNGLIYKSLTATSATFISSQWELVADLREVRVPNIPSRNALTGNTPTSGTTGIRIPILDNTNVLVLDAFNDPQVGVHHFARYNYNQTTNSWLLLQNGTGATNSNVNDYNLLINKKPIVSGVTVTAGAGLTGGGSVLGTAVAPYAAGGTISVSHADTSSQASITNSGYAYIQTLKFDTFGHVTGATSSTWVHPTGLTTNIVNTGTTYLQSIQLSNGHIIGVTSSPWVHPDTSSQASSNNSGNVFIQSIQLDTDGHVIGINTGTAAGGGGGGSPLKYNGDSGGVLTMNSGATLTISGGTNIATVRTGNAANPGLKINVNPAGLVNQIQINNGGALTASANLTFTGGTTLVTAFASLTSTPVSATTANDFLTRNANGAIQRVSFNTVKTQLAALPLNAIQYRTASGFGGHANWLFDPATQGVTLGTRSGATGQFSFALGSNANASGQYSTAFGLNVKASAPYSHAEGYFTTATGTFGAHAEGNQTVASGSLAHAEGAFAIASGIGSHAQNRFTIASGDSSHAGGYGQFVSLIAKGAAAFIHSTNNGLQTTGFGALADYSAILGGINHNIASGNTGSAIIGGNTIKLTGSTYVDHVAVANLAIMTNPTLGIAGDDVLVRSSTTGRIRRVTQASLAGASASPAGSTGSIQIKSASGAFASTANLYYSTGTSFLVTDNLNISALPVSGNTGNALLMRNPGTGNVERFAISNLPGLPINSVQYNGGSGFAGNANWLFDPTFQALTLGTRSGSTGQYSLSIGQNNSAAGLASLVVGLGNKMNVGGNSCLINGQGNILNDATPSRFASGFGNTVLGRVNAAIGYQNVVGVLNSGANQASIAIGLSNVSTGFTSIAIGNLTKSIGNSSIAMGLGFSASVPILASGFASINISNNDNSQTVGNGALGFVSTIIGGQNHNIGSTANQSAIFGGTLNRITGVGQKSAIIGGSTNLISGSTNQASIFGGSNNVIGGNHTSVAIVAGNQNKMKGVSSNNSAIVGGLGNLMFTSGTTSNNIILGGNQSSILGGGTTSLMLGSNFSIISGNSTVNSIQFSTIINGGGNQILNRVVSSTIIGGQNNTLSGSTIASPGFLGILGGSNNKIIGNASNSTIIGGNGNAITGSSQNNSIIASQTSKINSGVNQSAIIGGSNITLTGASQSNNVVVSNLMIWNTPATALSGDSVLEYNTQTKKVTVNTQQSIGNNRYSNIAYVSLGGSDITGRVNNPLAPFLTFNAAIAALNSSLTGKLSSENRGLVYVLPGRYIVTSQISIVSNIDLHLEDAHIVSNLAGPTSVFPSFFAGDFSITSNNGKITVTGGTANTIFLFNGALGNNYRIQLDEILFTNSGTVISTSLPASNTVPVLSFRVRRVITSNPASLVAQFAGNCDVEIDYMIGTVAVMWGVIKIKTLIGSSVFFGSVNAFGGNLDYYGDITYTGATNPALNWNYQGSSTFPITANYYGNVISDSSTAAALMAIHGGSANSRLRVFGSIKNVNSGNAPALMVDSSHIALIGGTYLVAAGSANSITISSFSQTVYLYGTVVANTAKNASITTAIGSLIVDPNVV